MPRVGASLPFRESHGDLRLSTAEDLPDPAPRDLSSQIRLVTGWCDRRRRLFQQAVLTLQRHFTFSFGQSLKDALPEAGGAPQPITRVDRLPLAALLRHRA